MKNKNMMFLIILVFTILLLIFLINVTISKVDKNNVDDSIVDVDIQKYDGLSKEDKEKVEKYSVYMENLYTEALAPEQRVALIDMIDEVLNAINTKEYALLYSKLKALYVDSMFPTQEKFEKYIDSITYGAIDYTCTYYNAEYYGYECLFTSVSQGTKIEIQISQLNNFSDYEVSFRADLIEINERPQVFYLNGISGVIDYEFVCESTLEYSASITNTTKQAITCSFGESTAIGIRRGRELQNKIISPVDDITIAAGESKDITFVFDVKSTETIKPTYLNISCKIGEKTESTKLYVDSLEDDIGL